MKLSQLLESASIASSVAIPRETLESEVREVTSDSRNVGPGSVFVAVRGTSSDGHAFIEDVLRSGARLILGEESATRIPKSARELYLKVPDSRAALGELASAFHSHPSRKMRMIGVTGTSGKTTTTYLLESILRASGSRPGVIGTVNFRYAGKVLDSTHTTPGPVELQSLLARMRDADCDSVVMEVSSHALRQSRVAGVAFDAMVFTNLSPEHLDFHPDMEDYFLSKRILFTQLAEDARRAGKKPIAAINEDDEFGRRLLEELRGASRWATPGGYSVGNSVKADVSGIRGRISGVEIESELIGSFNAANIAAAVTAARGLGVSEAVIARGVHELRSVPGRLERVGNSKGIHVLVDYAHKPDALEKVLQTLASAKGSGRLITVFGCGGDRDRTKRPVMGRIACDLSDRVYVTSDNPRTEDPAGILREIVAGTRGAPHCEVEIDRRAAIGRAIAEAAPGDIVLIAGKGHEDYQIIRDPHTPPGSGKVIKIHFDDREIAREWLAKTP